MKEIGGEFWDIPVKEENTKTLFPGRTQWYLSGRCALDAIVADIEKNALLRSAGLPSWCCESMILPFLKKGIKVFFYPVRREQSGGIVCDISQLPNCDAVLVMDYFGYRGNYEHVDFKGTVIRDMTHSIFNGKYSDADYYFGSLRKWAGFRTGGFAWKNDGKRLPVFKKTENAVRYTELRRTAMEEKGKYIDGRIEGKAYLNIFSEAEEILDGDVCGSVPESGMIFARRLDIDQIKGSRRKNAETLLKKLDRYALFPAIGEQDCPMFVPICLPQPLRDGLREYLKGLDIYCPIHWPLSNAHRLSGDEGNIYDTELSLVCDQRYAEDDMLRERDAVMKYLNEAGA